ncbi:four-carbon acid sugar kinase family protein [Kribbella sp. NPDC004875]|uniref:four-carbon acid sugar kinase family protein n=1 Tax=Kribbella sp. NPDC004875 TaxID=3364107 RepID=UPI0036C61037
MVEAAFYGDDFTGSTDALAQYARVGFRAVLLVTLPSASELAELATQYDVIGVAGVGRSLEPDEQEAEVRPALEALRELGPRVVQYKVCSTADSSPTCGSIGRALEIGRDVFGPALVPILVAQPELGRYTVFSHHFAAEAGIIHRLDRQPTMSTHPTTPMHESDLRRHLAAQTNLSIAALHVMTYETLPHHYATLSADAVVLDALTDDHLRAIGSTLLQHSTTNPSFTIGSGGLSRALALALPQPPTPAPNPTPSPTADGVVLVVSGSQSQRTREQIEHARDAGWTVIGLSGDDGARAVEVADQVVGACRNGADGAVVHTNDLRPADVADAPAELAQIVRQVIARTDVRRMVVAGGDTSGQVLRELGVSALELIGVGEPIAAGVHRCRVVAGELDGIEVLLKPGQLGGADLFTSAWW